MGEKKAYFLAASGNYGDRTVCIENTFFEHNFRVSDFSWSFIILEKKLKIF